MLHLSSRGGGQLPNKSGPRIIASQVVILRQLLIMAEETEVDQDSLQRVYCLAREGLAMTLHNYLAGKNRKVANDLLNQVIYNHLHFSIFPIYLINHQLCNHNFLCLNNLMRHVIAHLLGPAPIVFTHDTVERQRNTRKQ